MQLERWEPLVAERLVLQFNKQPIPEALVWQISFERHSCAQS